ncbi:hypothetical protein C8R43DRAFT_1009865 [Mycena crocata]|nr:hypothetical protein C8R43DRAFT_1009865 [Mycena crocata]
MPQDDIEHGKDPRHIKKSDSAEEGESAGLWTVYIAEAEKYDKALVDSWRSDMSGLLIFAGLFSASLTAFLVESYRTLSPEPSDSIAALLERISNQLSDSANTALVTTPATFEPSVSALVCNALWFISLTLSLTCALVATLVEQWARDFLHRAEIRSSPVERARIFSYLYYGLKRFQMHSVVEVLPLLLHVSLVLFLAGLVAFLAPVNNAITILAAALLGLVLMVYSVLTALPLIHFDCPYRTPLSGAIWRVWHEFRCISSRTIPTAENSEDSGNMVGEISRRAVEPSKERSVRDRRALVWTVKSLADDNELEPLVETIPDVLWGPNGERHTYDEHVVALVQHPEARLLWRISDMLGRCESGLLNSTARAQRQITCYKALWAISSLKEMKTSDQSLFEWPVIPSGASGSTDVKQYMLSALALARWNAYSALSIRLLSTIQHLQQFDDQMDADHSMNLGPVSDLLRSIYQHPIFGFHPFPLRRRCSDHLREIDRNNDADPHSNMALIIKLITSLQTFRADIPHIILFDYLYEVTKLGTTPYQFDRTRETLVMEDLPLSSDARLFLERIFNTIVSNNLDTLRITSAFHLFDKIIGLLVSYWRPQLIGHGPIPIGLVKYLNARGFDGAVLHVVWQFGPDPLWACIASAFPDALPPNPGTEIKILPDDLLMALWRLYSLQARIIPTLATCESTLHAISQSASCSVSTSVVALTKVNILDCFRPTDRNPQEGDSLSSILGHPMLSRQTSHKIRENSDLRLILHGRITEARVEILSEFLECCSSSDIPYNATKTLSIIEPRSPLALIHRAHQLRMVQSIQNLFHSPATQSKPDVLEAALHLHLFDVYADGGNGIKSLKQRTSPAIPWMDHPKARQIMKAFLVDYEENLISSGRPPAVVARVKTILHGMDVLHPMGPRIGDR